MKKIINILLVSLTMAGLSTFTGCHEPGDPIDELSLDRVLTPLQFEMAMEANVNATFTWKAMSATREYLIQLIREDGSIYEERTLTYDKNIDDSPTMSAEFPELPATSKFTARLRGLSSNDRQADSNPVDIAFETGVENLFLNDGIVADEDVTATTAIMRWKAGSIVTHLEVDNGVGKIALDATAIEVGEYELTNLTTGKTYLVQLYNEAKDAYRGVATFVASDKIDLSVSDKTAISITIAWGSDVTVTSAGVRLGSDESATPVVTDLSPEQISARSFTFQGLDAKTEYRISAYNNGVEVAALYVSTLGFSTAWDFTTWTVADWSEPVTIDGLTMLATSADKNIRISEDSDFGYNFLDLRGKSTITGTTIDSFVGAPTERALRFSVNGEGVIVIDNYANGAGRNFYAYVDVLDRYFGPVEAPVKADRGKVFIPCPGIPGSANVYIFTDATINHIYSIEWYEGTEAPGQNAEKLPAPVVTATPAQITKGDAMEVKFSWGAVANAASYDYKITYTLAADETTVTLSDNTTATEFSIAAADAALIKPGTYTVSVNAVPASEYKYSTSSAGTFDFVVKDTKLDTPVVTLTPASITVGTSTDITVSWAAVPGAASYQVHTPNIGGGFITYPTTNSATIAANFIAVLPEGSYEVWVQAIAADPTAQDSDLGIATLNVTANTGGSTTKWNFSDGAFADLITRLTASGSTGISDIDETFEGLNILSGGATLRGGTSAAGSYIQPGGAGSETRRVFSFTATGSGTVKVLASNTGNSAATDGRSVTVKVGNGAAQSIDAGVPSDSPIECEFTITASAGETVYIYPSINGLRFYSIEYSTGGDVGGNTPTPEEWNFTDEGFSPYYNAIGTENITVYEDTWDGLTIKAGGKSLKVGTRSGERYLQPGGAGSINDRVVSFTATSSGKVTVVASNTGNNEDLSRMVTINVNGVEQKLPGGTAANAERSVCEFDVTVTQPTTVYIYPTGNGLCLYSIVYTPQ